MQDGTAANQELVHIKKKKKIRKIRKKQVILGLVSVSSPFSGEELLEWKNLYSCESK